MNEYGDGRSETRGKAFVLARTTICFSWLMYPRMKPLYTMLANRHSVSSSDTSIPFIFKPQWNMDIGIREPCDDASQLGRLVQPVKSRVGSYTQRNTPRMQSSRALSSVSQRFKPTSFASHRSNALSNATGSLSRIAEIKGEKRSWSTGNRFNNISDGR